MAVNLTRISQAITSAWGIDADSANEISLHIADAYEDWRRLSKILEGRDLVSDEELADEVQSMLLHTPNHLVAAAYLMNIPIIDVWDHGISIQPNETIGPEEGEMAP